MVARTGDEDDIGDGSESTVGEADVLVLVRLYDAYSLIKKIASPMTAESRVPLLGGHEVSHRARLRSGGRTTRCTIANDGSCEMVMSLSLGRRGHGHGHYNYIPDL